MVSPPIRYRFRDTGNPILDFSPPLEHRMKVSLFHKTFIPLFAGSKTSTSKFGWSEEVRWEAGCTVNARLVKANNQWGMNKAPTD